MSFTSLICNINNTDFFFSELLSYNLSNSKLTPLGKDERDQACAFLNIVLCVIYI